MKDYYSIFEVPRNASQETIRDQYRFLIQAWHPDKFPNPSQKERAEEKTKEINEAYEVLKNPAKRDQYDRTFFGQSYWSSEKQDQQRANEEQRRRKQSEESQRRAAYERQKKERDKEKQPSPVRRQGFRNFLGKWVGLGIVVSILGLIYILGIMGTPIQPLMSEMSETTTNTPEPSPNRFMPPSATPLPDTPEPPATPLATEITMPILSEEHDWFDVLGLTNIKYDFDGAHILTGPSEEIHSFFDKLIDKTFIQNLWDNDLFPKEGRWLKIDVDGDGQVDFWVSPKEAGSIYQRIGDGRYTRVWGYDSLYPAVFNYDPKLDDFREIK